MIVICLGMFTASATAVQVNLKPKMVSVGTQTSLSPQTSTPLASPEQTVDDDDDNATVISDLSWVPEEPMDEEELFDEEPPYTCDPHHKWDNLKPT